MQDRISLMRFIKASVSLQGSECRVQGVRLRTVSALCALQKQALPSSSLSLSLSLSLSGFRVEDRISLMRFTKASVTKRALCALHSEYRISLVRFTKASVALQG